MQGQPLIVKTVTWWSVFTSLYRLDLETCSFLGVPAFYLTILTGNFPIFMVWVRLINKGIGDRILNFEVVLIDRKVFLASAGTWVSLPWLFLFVQQATLVSPRLAWLMRGDWRGARCSFITSQCCLTLVPTYEEPGLIQLDTTLISLYLYPCIYNSFIFLLYLLPVTY